MLRKWLSSGSNIKKENKKLPPPPLFTSNVSFPFISNTSSPSLSSNIFLLPHPFHTSTLIFILPFHSHPFPPCTSPFPFSKLIIYHPGDASKMNIEPGYTKAFFLSIPSNCFCRTWLIYGYFFLLEFRRSQLLTSPLSPCALKRRKRVKWDTKETGVEVP